MSARLNRPGGELSRWYDPGNTFNGFHDNSIAGVAALNAKILGPSSHVYYVSFGFAATVHTESLRVTAEDVEAVLHSLPPLHHVSPRLTWPFASIAAFSANQLLPYVLPTVVERVLSHLPADSLRFGPLGSQIPRADMFPAFLIFAYGMGGYTLTSEQVTLLGGGIDNTAMQRNDGVVNTASMLGPVGSTVIPVTAQGVAAPRRGVFYYVGENDALDHADAVGIVVAPELVGPSHSLLTVACRSLTLGRPRGLLGCSLTLRT